MSFFDYYNPQVTLDLLKALESQRMPPEDFQKLHHLGAEASPADHAAYSSKALSKPTKKFGAWGGNAATARRLKLALDAKARGLSWDDAVASALILQPLAENSVPTNETAVPHAAGASPWSQLHDASIFFALGETQIDTGSYQTDQTWRAPHGAWIAAQRASLPLAIIFGDASVDSTHAFRWAIVRELNIGVGGTQIKWGDVRVISRRATDLIKTSDGTEISASFRRGCSVVQTPRWLDLTATPAAVARPIGSSAIVPDDLEIEDQMRRLRLRRNQSRFRQALMEAYENRCAVSGVEVGDVLEAAHIDSHAETGNNAIDNGLILRADLHALFDEGLLLIDPVSLTIRVARAVTDPLYRELDGRVLRIPLNGDGPRRGALQERWLRHAHLL